MAHCSNSSLMSDVIHISGFCYGENSRLDVKIKGVHQNVVASGANCACWCEVTMAHNIALVNFYSLYTVVEYRGINIISLPLTHDEPDRCLWVAFKGLVLQHDLQGWTENTAVTSNVMCPPIIRFTFLKQRHKAKQISYSGPPTSLWR